MPCRDYEDDNRWENSQLRQQNNKLARVACGALAAFAEANPDACNAFLAKHHEAKKWWNDHKAADEAARLERERKEHEFKVKAGALAKLTDEERKALGL